MKRLYLLLTMASLAIAGFANITLTVDTENYVFTGTNQANNYQFVLSPYEFTNGPQFQLVIKPIDASKPAQFTVADLEDSNYWEPMFKYYTQQLAGQEMLAQNNIKRLYLGDVQLLPGQFVDYDNLHIIGFDLTKDYILPLNCFRDAGQRLDEVNVNCDGLMTLESNSIPANKMFVVNVNTPELQQTWEQYKTQFNCQYIVSLQQGTGITGLSIVVNMGGNDEEQALPSSGMPEADLTEGGQVAENAFIIRGIKATTVGNIQSLMARAAVYEYGKAPSQWNEAAAQQVADGQWQALGLNIDVLQGLAVGSTYVLELYAVATDAQGQSCYFNNGGENYKVRFKVGDGTQQNPVTFYEQATAGVGLRINGSVVDFVLNGDGTKSPSGLLGSVSQLAIDSYWVRCIRQSGVELNDVSMQYRLCFDDASPITAWSRLDYQWQQDEDGDKHHKRFEASGLGRDLGYLCEDGESYILEVMYQLVDANTGNYYFFAKGEEVGRFYFTWGTGSAPGDVTGDGNVDIADVNAAINVMLGKELNSKYDGRADQTGDGNVDIADVNKVINAMLGK